MTGSLIIAPVLFILGAFFVMLPYSLVRGFGVVLVGFAALTGGLSHESFGWSDYVVLGVLSLISMGTGANVSYQLTKGRIKRLIKQNKTQKDEGKQMMVPYAKDGSWFHPGLSYSDGSYRIGQKGSETVVGSYTEALARLREMPVACWRRPSPRTGALNTVSATHWAQPPDQVREPSPESAAA